MAYQQKPDTGALFINDKKETDKHPDRKGDGNLTCPHCGANFAVWLSGWLGQTQAGKAMLKLAFKPKDQASKPAARKPVADDMGGDEIPF